MFANYASNQKRKLLLALQKILNFPFRISSVNVTKTLENYTEEIHSASKLRFSESSFSFLPNGIILCALYSRG